MVIIEMYKYDNIIYLNEEENAELLIGDLPLTRIIHADDASEIPTDEYFYVYIVDRDVRLF